MQQFLRGKGEGEGLSFSRFSKNVEGVVKLSETAVLQVSG